MRNWKFLSAVFIIIVILVVSFTFFYSKKGPEPPKPPQKKVELPPPKIAEPSKKDVNEIKEEPKTTENVKEITKKDEKLIDIENKELPQKPKSPAMIPAPVAKPKKLPKIVDFDRLNREFSSYGLNVWASEFKNNEILLNGYVKSEKKRGVALSIARRYNVNITDMINIVEVYNIEESENNRVHQPLPFSR
jgi:hypothetical protein